MADGEVVFELNRVERRALKLGAVLVALGAVARIGLGPGPEEWAWQPVAAGEETLAEGGATAEGRPGALAGTRDAVEAALAAEERASRPLAPGERLDPNRAPVEELRRLPGVGPARAEAIVAARSAEPFRIAEDLVRVRGIGPASLDRLRPHLVLEGESADRARPGGLPLDLNRADSLALLRLPGIGPSRARQIVRTRERLGGFGSVEDLLEVPGIGPATLERLRPLVRIR